MNGQSTPPNYFVLQGELRLYRLTPFLFDYIYGLVISFLFFPACSVLALLREQTGETEQGLVRALISQEQLIRKAAGLSHFLSNEVAVAQVSTAPPMSLLKAHCAL